jgi:hypothetical protein
VSLSELPLFSSKWPNWPITQPCWVCFSLELVPVQGLTMVYHTLNFQSFVKRSSPPPKQEKLSKIPWLVCFSSYFFVFLGTSGPIVFLSPPCKSVRRSSHSIIISYFVLIRLCTMHNNRANICTGHQDSLVPWEGIDCAIPQAANAPELLIWLES